MALLRMMRLLLCRTRLKTLAVLVILGTIFLVSLTFVYGAASSPDSNSNKQSARSGNLVDSLANSYQNHHSFQPSSCKLPPKYMESTENEMPTDKTIECDGKEAFYFSNGRLQVNDDVLEKKSISYCQYYGIRWKTDWSFVYVLYGRISAAPWTITIEDDFIRIRCFSDIKESLKNVPRADNINHKQEMNSNDTISEKRRNKLKFAGGERDESVPIKDGSRKLSEDKRQDYDKLGNKEHKIIENSDMLKMQQENEADIDEFLANVQRQDDVLDRTKDVHKRGNNRLNVLVLGFESTSAASFKRLMPNTHAFLHDQLYSVNMHGYHTVGHSKTTALLAMLTGRLPSELPEIRQNKLNTNLLDTLPFVWKKYEQENYVTMFAEDQPEYAAFQKDYNGFEDPPTDHYMRTFWLATESSSVHAKSNDFCLGDKPQYQYVLKYLESFFYQYKELPKFAFGFLGYNFKQKATPAKYADAGLYAFFKKLFKDGHLERTAVVLLSDKGFHAEESSESIQNKLEQRLPYLSILLPIEFRKRYPKLMENLQVNSHRLTSPFDVYSTLRDSLDLLNKEKEVLHKSKYGKSLFSPLLANRTCADAGVEAHWCACLEAKKLRSDDEHIQQAAETILQYINKQTDELRDKCTLQQLGRIRKSSQLQPVDEVLRYKATDKDTHEPLFYQNPRVDNVFYKLTIETSPGNFIYEVTVEHLVQGKLYRVVGDIQRNDHVGETPSCLSSAQLLIHPFCHCT